MSDKKNVKETTDFFPILGKYDASTVKIEDRGLEKYIKLDTKDLFLGAPYANRLFGKSKVPIIERLINNLMRTEMYTGKKTKSYKVVKMTFEIIHLKSGQNPIGVLVQAVEEGAPCEDTTRIGYGGITYHRAVDISPQRRVDLALRHLAEGARRSAFGNRKTIEECLADELLFAASGDSRSFAIQRRDEMERVAQASR